MNIIEDVWVVACVGCVRVKMSWSQEVVALKESACTGVMNFVEGSGQIDRTMSSGSKQALLCVCVCVCVQTHNLV